jgi:hypothetical protein
MFSRVKLRPLSPRPHAVDHCDCPAHRHAVGDAARDASWWGAFLPIFACAVCPACFSAWAPLLATAGLGLALTESQHTALLVGTTALSLAVAVWHARRTRAWLPVLLTGAGGTCLLAGHVRNDNALLAALGVLCFLSAAALGVWSKRNANVAASSVTDGQVET